MARFIAVFILGFLFLLPEGKSAEIAAPGTPIRKLQRGFLNIALSPAEISHELAKERNKDNFIPDWFTGLGRGSFFMVGRALVGGYEILTAPIPLPSRYEPVIYPEFEWEHFAAGSPAKNQKSTPANG